MCPIFKLFMGDNKSLKIGHTERMGLRGGGGRAISHIFGLLKTPFRILRQLVEACRTIRAALESPRAPEDGGGRLGMKAVEREEEKQ